MASRTKVVGAKTKCLGTFFFAALQGGKKAARQIRGLQGSMAAKRCILLPPYPVKHIHPAAKKINTHLLLLCCWANQVFGGVSMAANDACLLLSLCPADQLTVARQVEMLGAKGGTWTSPGKMQLAPS